MRRLGVLVGGLLALLVVLGVVLVGAEWAARREVEQRIAAGLAETLGVVPTVTLYGSALLALVSDDVTQVDVRTDRARVRVEGHELAARVDVRARSVDGLVRGEVIRVGELTGTVGGTWSDLERLTGATVGYAGDGKVAAASSVTVLGERLPVTVTGRPALATDGSHLRVLDPTATVDGLAVPADIVAGLVPRAESHLRVPDLPQVRLTSVTATEAGPQLGISGADLAVVRP